MRADLKGSNKRVRQQGQLVSEEEQDHAIQKQQQQQQQQQLHITVSNISMPRFSCFTILLLAIAVLHFATTLVSAFQISAPTLMKTSKYASKSIHIIDLHFSKSHTSRLSVTQQQQQQQDYCHSLTRMRMSSEWNNDNNDDDGTNANNWRSMDEGTTNNNKLYFNEPNEDWQEMLARRSDGSFWSSFEPSTDSDEKKKINTKVSTRTDELDEDSETDAWLQTLASLSAEEIEFNRKEADRADTARRMAEWGFDSKTIENTLDVATTTRLETKDEVKGMQKYREESFYDTVDLETVESHTTVEIDDDTGEPIRARMVYVDEHTCIGCTNCAMIAQSTFFMHSEYGRARVFQQWGDDDETIQIAIETCPVDCIHYVPYDELKALEIDRRNQLINFKSRLVSQAENGNTLSHKVGGIAFTAPQKISGNMRARCNNCPSRGCRNCPMYGVGKNPEYEKKEAARVERLAKRKLQKQREMDEKSIDL